MAACRSAFAAAFAFLVLTGAAHCDRTPPEPVQFGSARPHLASRCLRKTPDAPPPPAPAGPDPTCPADPAGTAPKLAMSKITFPDAPGAPSIDVELARADAERERGLMYRRELGEDRGMIFVFDGSDIHTFWMHNTCMPLDMYFVADDGFITGILENVPTMNDEPRSVTCPAKYVLETNAGYARRHGIKAGQTLRLRP